MSSFLCGHSGNDLRDDIRELYLGTHYKENESAIIVNLVLAKDADCERFRSVDVFFRFDDEEIYCCIREIRKGSPLQLILQPITSEATARRFLGDPRAVCLVPKIALREPCGRVWVIQNMRFNPECFD